MNNVYFSEKGVTSTEMQHLCNISKELTQQLEEKLNRVEFFQTSISAIGSSAKQLMSKGTTDISFIEEALNTISEANAFCAWGREAIKEKDNQLKELNNLDIEDYMLLKNIEGKKRPLQPDYAKTYSEKDVFITWDINKQNKYLEIEAHAATIGKYIHPNGAYSKARAGLHKAINTPILKEGSGRDLILYYFEDTVDVNDVEETFLHLQNIHRKYEKELNFMKAELKETANKWSQEACDKYKVELDEYYAEKDKYDTWYREMRNEFNKWRVSETERISQLKITIPDSLNGIFQRVKSMTK